MWKFDFVCHLTGIFLFLGDSTRCGDGGYLTLKEKLALCIQALPDHKLRTAALLRILQHCNWSLLRPVCLYFLVYLKHPFQKWCFPFRNQVITGLISLLLHKLCLVFISLILSPWSVLATGAGITLPHQPQISAGVFLLFHTELAMNPICS